MRKPICAAVFAFACIVLAQQEPAPAPPGRLVDLGGYRIHLNCSGGGSPTVVLSPGGGSFSFHWILVQQKVSAFARVCSYDRAGSAWSDPGPQPLTMRQETLEVRRALELAGERAPYVLVGQSLGGLVMRVFADRYPRDTAGLVLVDATSPDTTLGMRGKLVHVREQAKNRPIPEVQTIETSPPRPPSADELKQWADFRKQVGEPKISPPFDRLPAAIQKLHLWASSLPPRAAESDNYFAEELAQMYEQTQRVPAPLGDKQLVTIVAGRQDPAPPGMTQGQWDALTAEKVQEKRGYVRLSHNSKFVFDAKSGHSVHLDDPDTVVDAIRDVRTAAAKQSRIAQ